MPHGLTDPLSQLLLQLVTILVITRIAGRACARLGQPAVIGEMAAGILLGPSLLGWLAPDVFHALFPDTSLDALQLLSQIGVCLFLFVVGMTMDVSHIRHNAPAAVLISHASIVVPAILGGLLSLALFPSLAGAGAAFTPFALFMGISMSITAFPVLARILEERGMSRTPLGTMALTCAAVDDATAWSLLAGIVAMTQADGWSASVVTVALVLAFVVVMVGGVRRWLPRWLGADANAAPPSGIIVPALALMLVSALVTEIIGIHALFGAFLAGAVMPVAGGIRPHLTVRIEEFSTVFLLPLFFVFTGLRTSITLLDDAGS